jgi:hypothetical protein
MVLSWFPLCVPNWEIQTGKQALQAAAPHNGPGHRTRIIILVVKPTKARQTNS